MLEPQPYRFSAEEFLQMAETGIFPPDKRIELIDGEIVEMPPSGPGHDGFSSRINRVLTRRLPERALVRPTSSLPIASTYVPLPDYVVVPFRNDFYETAHPTASDVELVVEVSDTPLHYDRNRKSLRFAQARVPEYWIVDVNNRRLIILRRPRDDGYQLVQTLGPGQTVRPLAFPETEFATSDLLGG